MRIPDISSTYIEDIANAAVMSRVKCFDYGAYLVYVVHIIIVYSGCDRVLQPARVGSFALAS